MGFNGNWVDLSIIVVLIAFALEGVGRPFIFELFDLISFALAFISSLKFYSLASVKLENSFSLPHSFANVLGFIAVWFLSETVLFFATRFILSKIHQRFRLPADKFLGMAPAFIRGIVFISIFLVLVATFPIQPQIKRAVNQSRLGSLLLNKTYLLEVPLKNVFGDLSKDTLTFLTVEPKTNESVSIGFKTDKFFFDEKVESQMIELVNKERVSRSLKPLKFDSRLQGVARQHSADMFLRGYFSHYSPEGKNVADRIEAAGIDYLVVGENLAFAPSLELSHQGLMNSEGHRANILSEDFGNIGIGVANGAEYGLMFTQVFRN